MRILFPVLLLVAGCTTRVTPPAAPVIDGSSVGNGSDDLPGEAASAWFLGKRSIRYCVEVAPDFGLAPAQVRAQVADALVNWKDYLETRKVNSKLSRMLGTQAWKFRILLQNEEIPQCDASADLTFYFGVENEVVKTARRRYVDPFGLAERQTYDWRTGWGRGFVWIKDARHLSTILLHEMGHVLGCGHVGGTIMDKAIGESTLETIDGQRTLVSDAPTELRFDDVVVDHLMEYDRTPGEAEIFKIAFESPDTDNLQVGALSTDTVSYSGVATFHQEMSRHVVVQYNSPVSRWRMFAWNHDGTLELLGDYP